MLATSKFEDRAEVSRWFSIILRYLLEYLEQAPTF